MATVPVEPDVDSRQNEPELAEIYGDEPPDLHLRLWDVLLQTSQAHPNHEALVSLWQTEESSSIVPQTPAGSGERKGPVRWNYGQLRGAAEQLAGRLKALGCNPGMHLAAILWNSTEWALFFWASAKLGMTFVPIDPTSAEAARTMLSLIRPALVVVQTSEEALGLDLDPSGAHLNGPTALIQCSETEVSGWTRLCDVLSTRPQATLSPACVPPLSHNLESNHAGGERVALIVFTSGTTGSPKGCPHTDRNLISQSCDYDPEADPSTFHRWLVHTPSFHIFAVNNALRAWRYGGAVVFPSRSFDVEATVRALMEERCSVMSATPTLAKALLAQPSFPSPQELNLHVVSIGGTTISARDIRLCRQALGADHAIQVYGMSEGGPLVTWRRFDPLLVEGYHPGIGKILPGAAVRVCRPGSRDVLKRCEVGELHVSGPSVIKEYLNGDSEDSMYSDDCGTWLMTGDQAQIDDDGIVYFFGRYKDLIIRGGENISSASIESKLAELDDLQVQVVGVPDDIAGQVPVAISKLSGKTTKLDIMKKSRDLGRRYALDAVYTLEEIGLQEFPVTSIGKMKKESLRRAVSQFREHAMPQNAASENDALVDKLLDVWQQLSRVRPSRNDSIMYLADSITLLRYCENVLRLCGKRLYLQDFVENDTVEKQAQLLTLRDQQQARFYLASKKFPLNESSQQKPLLGRNSHEENQHSRVWGNSMAGSVQRQRREGFDDAEVWESAQHAIHRLGLEGAEIGDVLPIRESLHPTAVGSRPQSYKNRLAFLIRDTEEEKIRWVLEKALTSRPMMRTVVFLSRNSTPFHAVLSPTQTFLQSLIHRFEVNTEEEAMKLIEDDSPKRHSASFMFQADIIKVGDGRQHYLTMTYSHSIVDAISLAQWHHDLDQLMLDPNADIPAPTPYKLFSDLFAQYEDSGPARNNVRFHVKRLRGISRLQQALWPTQRAPGWMVSNDEGSVQAAERKLSRDTLWAGKWESRASEFRYPRCCRAVWLSSLARLKEKHGVHPSLLVKSAIAIFNVLQTGSSHALFTAWESGRSWPFVPDWMENLLPPAMSLDGPTAQWILNMIEIVKDETVAEFLQRMVKEQDLIRRHEHVPWGQVVQGLSDEGHVAVDASHRQGFVWDVSLGMSASRSQKVDFTVLEPKARYGWADNGIFWSAFSIDKDNIYFIASWDTAQMNEVEVEGCCDCLAGVMRNLVEERNWEKTIGQVFEV